MLLTIYKIYIYEVTIHALKPNKYIESKTKAKTTTNKATPNRTPCRVPFLACSSLK